MWIPPTSIRYVKIGSSNDCFGCRSNDIFYFEWVFWAVYWLYGLIIDIIIMIDKLEAVENSLKLWRAIILLLSIIMLIISFVGDDDMAIIVLIISLFALILFQLKNLPSTSYQVQYLEHSYSFFYSWPTSFFWRVNSLKLYTIVLKLISAMSSKILSTFRHYASL